MKRISLTLALAMLTTFSVAGSRVDAGNGNTIAAENGFAGLSLRIRDESAPADSIVQIKVDVTEPKPISTGKGKIKVRGLSSIEGIALMNHGQDTYGVALVQGDEVRFFISSPSGAFGNTLDYPIVAVAGTVAGNARIGETFPLTIEGDALRFIGPNGVEYPLEITNGLLTVANGVTIGDVVPGSTTVPAGGVVSIRGTNFVPDTRLQLSETIVSQTRFVNSHQIDVTLAQATDMHGVRIRAKNPDKSESTYFSYQRTTPMRVSSDPILSQAVPLFAPNRYTEATVILPKQFRKRGRPVSGHSSITPRSSVTLAFALQNLEASSAVVAVELLDALGHVYATTSVTVSPNQYLIQEIGEAFGSVASPASFRIRSATPLHVLGLVADHSADTALALPPG